jgi:hypothetical protein
MNGAIASLISVYLKSVIDDNKKYSHIQKDISNLICEVATELQRNNSLLFFCFYSSLLIRIYSTFFRSVLKPPFKKRLFCPSCFMPSIGQVIGIIFLSLFFI